MIGASTIWRFALFRSSSPSMPAEIMVSGSCTLNRHRGIPRPWLCRPDACPKKGRMVIVQMQPICYARRRIMPLSRSAFVVLFPLKVLNRDSHGSASSLIYSLRMRNTDSQPGPGGGRWHQVSRERVFKECGFAEIGQGGLSSEKLLVCQSVTKETESPRRTHAQAWSGRLRNFLAENAGYQG